MGKGFEQTFLQRYSDVNTRKGSQHFSHQGNPNQNHDVLSLHTHYKQKEFTNNRTAWARLRGTWTLSVLVGWRVAEPLWNSVEREKGQLKHPEAKYGFSAAVTMDYSTAANLSFLSL